MYKLEKEEYIVSHLESDWDYYILTPDEKKLYSLHTATEELNRLYQELEEANLKIAESMVPRGKDMDAFIEGK